MLAELYVECAGTGPTLVLAHGFAGSARNFRSQVRALRSRFRVVTYDASGHARSPAPEHGIAYTLEQLGAGVGAALDQAALLDQPAALASPVRHEPAVVGGLSLGAASALQFALDAPERVRGLLLASFPSGGGRVGSIDAGALAFAEAIERLGLDGAGERFVWGPASGLAPEDARGVRQGFLEHTPDGLCAVLRGALAALPDATRPPTRWASIRVPTLLVAGAADPGSLAASRALAAVLPEARLEVVEGAGHLVNLAQPARFNRLLAEFLDGLAPVGAPAPGASKPAP